MSDKFVQMRDELKQKVAQLEADLIPLAVSLGARADAYPADCQVISINELKAMLGSES